MNQKEKLINEFQCPGCVSGPDPDSCESFEFYEREDSCGCNNHVPGTRLGGVRSGLLCLGLPKGFCRVAGHKDKIEPHIRIYPKDDFKNDIWSRFNIAVWAMEKDGFLFVRTYMPRIDVTAVDVIEGGTLALVPDAVDVGEFVDGID